MSFQILLPIGPILLEASGPRGIGGAGTAALFAATVAGEFAAPMLLKSRRQWMVLLASQLFLAVPSLVFGLANPGLGLLITGMLARGLGTGVGITLCVAVLTDLTPRNQLGRAIGYFGLATGIPSIICPSIGVSLASSGHRSVAAGLAFASAFAAALLAVAIRGRPRTGDPSASLLTAVRRPGVKGLFVGFMLVSCTFGGVITFAPVALPAAGWGSSALFFLILGVARAGSRWLSGLVGDRRPVREVVIAGSVVTGLGTAFLTVSGWEPAVWFAGLTYGLGYGALQTGVFLAMNSRASRGDGASVSTLWNSAIDIGNALGGASIGVTAGVVGYRGAAWLMPALLLISVPFLNRTRDTSLGSPV